MCVCDSTLACPPRDRVLLSNDVGPPLHPTPPVVVMPSPRWQPAQRGDGGEGRAERTVNRKVVSYGPQLNYVTPLSAPQLYKVDKHKKGLVPESYLTGETFTFHALRTHTVPPGRTALPSALHSHGSSPRKSAVEPSASRTHPSQNSLARFTTHVVHASRVPSCFAGGGLLAGLDLIIAGELLQGSLTHFTNGGSIWLWGSTYFSSPATVSSACLGVTATL